MDSISQVDINGDGELFSITYNQNTNLLTELEVLIDEDRDGLVDSEKSENYQLAIENLPLSISRIIYRPSAETTSEHTFQNNIYSTFYSISDPGNVGFKDGSQLVNILTADGFKILKNTNGSTFQKDDTFIRSIRNNSDDNYYI